jgi:Ca2+-binding EF-hand superfamily protein
MNKQKLHLLMSATLVSAVVLVPSISTAATGDAPAAHYQKMKALDKDGDGKISRAEAAVAPHLAKRFDAIDANKDGFITAEEVKVARAKTASVMFKRIDTDNDGRISKAEADSKAPRLAKNFAAVDTNKDGFVSTDELTAARKKMAERN